MYSHFPRVFRSQLTQPLIYTPVHKTQHNLHLLGQKEPSILDKKKTKFEKLKITSFQAQNQKSKIEQLQHFCCTHKFTQMKKKGKTYFSKLFSGFLFS